MYTLEEMIIIFHVTEPFLSVYQDVQESVNIFKKCTKRVFKEETRNEDVKWKKREIWTCRSLIWESNIQVGK